MAHRLFGTSSLLALITLGTWSRADDVPPQALSEAPPCNGVAVRGLVRAEKAHHSLSLVGEEGRADWLRPGARVGPYRLLLVGSERAFFVRPSSATSYAVCHAELGAKPALAPEPPTRVVAQPAAGRALPLDHLLPRVVRTSETSTTLDRSVLDGLFEDQAGLMSLVRATPDMERGAIAGLKLTHVRPGSVVERLGLKSGDRLRSVAGVDLTTTEAALIAVAKLRSMPRFSLGIVRGERPMQLDFEVR